MTSMDPYRRRREHEHEHNAMMNTKVDNCPRRLNHLSVVWFWATICGVFYCGLGYVLPVIYADFGDGIIIAHHIFCYFMFIQMIVNWSFVKMVQSNFRPEDHLEFMSNHADEVANGGYEINLNHLKNGAETGTYSLPVQSLKPMDGNPSKQWDKDTMYVVAVSPDDGTGMSGLVNLPEDRRKLIYPYWSWKPCVICQCQRPPRAHHCPICNTCVLKRDHHCFFTGSCIGVQNQRHFVVFSFWASFATLYCVFHAIAYMFIEYFNKNSFLDLFLPFTVIRWFFGYISTLDTAMMALLYSVVWFCITSVGFFLEQVRIIRKGLTSFEEENSIKIKNTNTVAENLKCVFGEYWLANFFCPLHFIYPNTENGVDWSFIKA